MIPVKLSLLNFMSYRDGSSPALNFEEHHILCLSGDNGHGKSALLDAITWALWGKSRAKNDDDLVHHGESSMEVALDFRAQGNLYRVIRKRTRGTGKRPGMSLLELQISSSDGFNAITGNRLDETQHMIKDLLRIDYPTFINSAFLVQGKADLFTTATPAERKQILAEVLELYFYDRLEDLAKTRSKEADLEQQSISRELDAIKQELGQKETYEQAIGEQKHHLESIKTSLQHEADSLNNLRLQRADLMAQEGQVKELRQQIDRSKEEVRLLTSLTLEQNQRLDSHKTILTQKGPIEKGYAQFLEHAQEKEAMDQQVVPFTSLSQALSQLEGSIEAQRRERVSEEKILQQRRDEIMAKAQNTTTLSKQLREAENALLELEEARQANRLKQDILQKQYGEIHRMKASQGQLRTEMEDLRDRITRLDQGDMACPLCGTDLGTQGKDSVIHHYDTEGHAKKEAFLQIETSLEKNEKEHQTLQGEVGAFENWSEKEAQQRQTHAATLNERLSEAERVSKDLPSLDEQLSSIKKTLHDESYSLHEKKELATTKTKLNSLGYEPQRHEELRSHHITLEPFRDQFRELQVAEKEFSGLEQSQTERQQLLENRQNDLQNLENKSVLLEGALGNLAKIEEEFAEREALHSALAAQRDQDTLLIGGLEDKLARCTMLENLQTEKDQSWARIAEEKGIYDDLARAFGKNGIQAFIIENALPELEEETNRLLRQMTDNRMEVKIETLRLTQRGESRETLDIHVTDELGTRSFELFSGGEAFRISFALRIALSKLLAHRAGAPLPTLFIDEGFGTQDASGREKLVEAINAVQDDFQLIIVITHIEELKELFPTRIEVVKTTQGSSFGLN